MGESVPLADHFPLRSSSPSSIIPPLSALPRRITEKGRKGREGGSEGGRERGERLSKRVEKESRV